MARETKLGLGLVLILLTVFGFLVYKRAVNPLVTEGDPSEMAQADQNDTESPTSENQEAPTAETIVRTSGETTGGVLARPETSSDPFANPSQFEPSEGPVERTAVKTVASGTRPALPTAIDGDGDPFSSQDNGANPGKATVAMDQFSSQDGGGDPFSDSPSTGKSATVAASEQASVDGDPFGGTSTSAASPSASAGKSLPALPTNADDPFGGKAEPVEMATAATNDSSEADSNDPFTVDPAATKKSEPAAVALPVLGNLEPDDVRPVTRTPDLIEIESNEPDFGTDTAAMAKREPVREANADPFSSGPAMSFEAVEERPEPRTFPAAKSAQPVELLPKNEEPTTIAERESDADPFGASSEEAPRLEPVPETRSVPVDPFPAAEVPTSRPVIGQPPKIATPATIESDPFGSPAKTEFEPPARTPTMVDSSPDGFESPVEVASPVFEPANRTAASTTLLPGIGVGAANPDVRQPHANDYQIQEGDSFWSVSRAIYGTGRYWKALQAFNADRVPDPNRMKLGTRLATPPTDVLERMHANLIPRAAIPEVAIQPSSGVTNLGGEQPGFFIGDQGVPMYRVGSEDTLSTIAERHLGRSSRWIQVFEMNRDTLKNGNDLKIGAVLRLPADASQVQLVSDR